MPVFLKNAHPMDQFRCDCCGGIFPRAAIHEHHKVKRSSGGADTEENLTRLDAYCHHALHQVEAALKNPKRGSASDLAASLFPNKPAAQRKCLELAATAATGHDPEQGHQYLAEFDSEDLVVLPPVRVRPLVRQYAKVRAKELKNPTTGRALGLANYITLLIEADLKKHGFKI